VACDLSQEVAAVSIGPIQHGCDGQ
jgi:hypothetical protein